MLSIDSAVTFLTASVLLGLAPGPDNVFVLTQSALHGRVAGLWVTLGLCTGLLVHTSAVAFGVAAIFRESATAFSVLKFMGAAYLLYLAWQSFRAHQGVLAAKSNDQLSAWALYRRGIIMNVTNPKVSIFFLAFLPQFTDPARGSMTAQIILLGGLFILTTLLVFGGISFLAGTLSQWFLRSERTQANLNRVAGIVFVGIALKLALTKQ
jgi:threonine/homoserine/homoserine lactone efflux protein